MRVSVQVRGCSSKRGRKQMGGQLKGSQDRGRNILQLKNGTIESQLLKRSTHGQEKNISGIFFFSTSSEIKSVDGHTKH